MGGEYRRGDYFRGPTQRNNPACAGKAATMERQLRRGGTTPHVRGIGSVDVFLRWLRWDQPRIRGEYGYGDDAPWLQRGKLASSLLAPLTQEQPRVCGEKASSHERSKNPRGTTPRMRGKGLVARTLEKPLGNNPACAGNTFPGSSPSTRSREQPRVCGEYTC